LLISYRTNRNATFIKSTTHSEQIEIVKFGLNPISPTASDRCYEELKSSVHCAKSVPYENLIAIPSHRSRVRLTIAGDTERRLISRFIYILITRNGSRVGGRLWFIARNCPLSLTTNDSHHRLLESLTRVRRDAGVMVIGRQRFAIKRLWAQLPVNFRSFQFMYGPQQRLGI